MTYVIVAAVVLGIIFLALPAMMQRSPYGHVRIDITFVGLHDSDRARRIEASPAEASTKAEPPSVRAPVTVEPLLSTSDVAHAETALEETRELDSTELHASLQKRSSPLSGLLARVKAHFAREPETAIGVLSPDQAPVDVTGAPAAVDEEHAPTPTLFSRAGDWLRAQSDRWRQELRHQAPATNEVDAVESLHQALHVPEEDDNVNDLATGMMPLEPQPAVKEDSEGEGPPSDAEITAAVREALSSADPGRVDGVATLYVENPEHRGLVVSVLNDVRPDPAAIVPLTLAMLKGSAEDRQLAATLLFSVGMTDEAALVFDDERDDTNVLLIAQALETWDEERTRIWAEMHGIEGSRLSDYIKQANDLIASSQAHVG